MEKVPVTLPIPQILDRERDQLKQIALKWAKISRREEGREAPGCGDMLRRGPSQLMCPKVIVEPS
jgi:hypothetical protein